MASVSRYDTTADGPWLPMGTAAVEGRVWRNEERFWRQRLLMGGAAEMALDQPHEGAPGWVRWSDRAI